jgi:hypothetical protein
MPDLKIVSFSEIDRGRKCPHHHQRTYIERWTKPDTPGTPTYRGSMFHQVMENWYRSLMRYPFNKAAAMASVDQLFSDFAATDRDPDDMDLVRWMFEGYVERYGVDEEWKILAVEWRFQVPLRTATGRLSGFELKGGVDLVAEHRSTFRRWVWDHKSAANLPGDTHDLDLHDQFSMYEWALNQLGKNIFGCLYNGARRTRNKGDYPEIVEQWKADKAAGLKPGAEPKPQALAGRFCRIPTHRTVPEQQKAALDALESARYLYSKANKGTRHPDPERCKRMCSIREACLHGRKLGDDRELQFLKDTGWVQDYRRH